MFQYWAVLQQWKFAQQCNKFAKIGLIFCQIRNEPSKFVQRLVKFCQSGEILPNLVTLQAATGVNETFGTNFKPLRQMSRVGWRFSRAAPQPRSDHWSRWCGDRPGRRPVRQSRPEEGCKSEMIFDDVVLVPGHWYCFLSIWYIFVFGLSSLELVHTQLRRNFWSS